MKILSVDYHSVNSLSGIATFNRNLNDFFHGRIDFLTIYKKENIFNVDEFCYGVPYTFPYKLFNYFSSYRAYSYLTAKKVNVCENSVVIFNSPSLLNFCKKGNNKYILVQHQDFSVMFANKSGFFSSEKYLNKVFDNIDIFICLSSADREKVKEFIPAKHHCKLKIIPHTTKLETGVVKTVFNRRLLMLGRLDNKQKRYDLVINAMNKLPDWTLSIYGSGKDKEYIKSLINNSKCTNINLFDFSSDVESIFDSHDIHVMSSDFEGYPITNIEAITRGMPLILRDTFSSASDIIDGNGILLESSWCENDFIKSVMKIEEHFEFYSSNSIKLSRKFSSEKVSKMWNDIITECSI